MNGPQGLSAYAQGEAQSARTLALVAFIFFAITAGIWALVILIVFFQLVVNLRFGVPFFIVPLVVPFGAFFGLSLGFGLWARNTMRDIDAGQFDQAEAASLVMGIIGLFVNIISGVLFLIAYAKLTNVRRYATGRPAFGPPVAPARYCTECGRAVPPDARYCPHCGNELPE